MSAGTSEFFCLISLLVCSCTAQEKITAEPGQDVILPCKASNINDINDITAAEWIRPVLDPEYVLLYRDGRFDPHNQHPYYKNRVDLQNKEMKDGDFYLILKKVTMNDTGIYVCRVSQKGKTEPFSNIYLEVRPPDHSRAIVGLAVGLPLGVLVCLLLAAAVFLYRQYRKMTEALAKTIVQGDLEASVTIEEVNLMKNYISLQNKSSEEIELEGCRLEVQRNNREPDIYHLRRQ
ncbi:myelin-oligodendrocyte glycoprotein-like [Acanthochromis polyacanthus]|uniref:myelin-oligodendrocyte glycoprotein-like n=1 Tax=Acanthochromis polyacanthus TaxID=80966 RepID=UPI002234BA23|nr:myelin-oligodendrocyte glycoprotein-like [Acanthochromis polyacanthus]